MPVEKKTNAMRILETLSIPYRVVEYQFDEENSDAVTAAKKTGLPPEQVFKTIVMRNNNKEIFVFCVPADQEVNLKKVRMLTNSKEILPVKQAELLALTGYIRGGCSPLGMKRKYTTYIDETAQLCDFIAVSAGQRGRQILLKADDLAKAADACFVELF